MVQKTIETGFAENKIYQTKLYKYALWRQYWKKYCAS
jgi:hypothetical protein